MILILQLQKILKVCFFKRYVNIFAIKQAKLLKESQAKNSVSNNPLDIWSSSAPYHFLLTTVSGISIKHNLNSPPIRSMGIKEILSPEFGEIIESVQFNYCIDMEWLMEKYPIHARFVWYIFAII